VTGWCICCYWHYQWQWDPHVLDQQRVQGEHIKECQNAIRILSSSTMFGFISRYPRCRDQSVVRSSPARHTAVASSNSAMLWMVSMDISGRRRRSRQSRLYTFIFCSLSYYITLLCINYE
jgi:hypothetical protein